MSTKKNIKTEFEIFNDFTNLFLKEISPNEFYKLISTFFIDRMKFDLVVTYIYCEDKKFKIKNELKGNWSFPNEISNSERLIAFFKNRSLKIIKKGDKLEDKFLELFPDIKKIHLAILTPLIRNDHLFGTICLVQKNSKISNLNFDFLHILLELINYILGNSLVFDLVKYHNQKLQEIAKSMRHDLANDIQSIAMVHELLITTTLSNDQLRFVKLLGNAKNSITNKLMNLKQQKDIFDEEIDYNIGLLLND